MSAARPTRKPRPGRLVHLAVDHDHVREHARRFHVVVKLLALARTLADAAKHADPLLVPDHVVNHLGEQHGLAHARAAEESRLAAAFQRQEHVDDLDARLENLGFRGTLRQRRRRAMHGTPLEVGRRRTAVDDVAEHVEHPRKDFLADRRFERPARVFDHHAASETLRGRQRDPAHVMRIALREHFDDDLPFPPRVQDRGNRRQTVLETHVDDAAAHRDDGAEVAALLTDGGMGGSAGVGGFGVHGGVPFDPPGARRSSVTPGIHTTPGSLEPIHRPLHAAALSGETRITRPRLLNSPSPSGSGWASR